MEASTSFKLLRKAGNEMAFAKIGIQGFAGAGKTYTASEIAIGLHRYTKAVKPIAFLDTETGSDFMVERFNTAGIELLVAKTKSFKDMLSVLKESEGGASILIVDSISHIWAELQESFKKRLGITSLEFQHWAPIKKEWSSFTAAYLAANLHVIICGRAAYEYDFDTNENGKKELIKTGIKMRAEGEFGFEPSLLIEMSRANAPLSGSQAPKRGTPRETINRALVIKDRTDRIDGQVFDNPTFESFLPHFEQLNIGGEHRTVDTQTSSESLFDEKGAGEWHRERRARDRWFEEFTGLLESKYPGTSGEAKKAKNDLFRRYLNTHSVTAAKDMQSEALHAAYLALQNELEPLVAPVDGPDEEAEFISPALPVEGKE